MCAPETTGNFSSCRVPAVAECLTKACVWEDHAQVDELHVRKKYGERDEILITVEKMEVTELTRFFGS
jgi:hypothetical protein